MLLTYNQGQLLYQPMHADDNHRAIVEVAPDFFARYLFLQWSQSQFERNYTTNADFETFRAANGPGASATDFQPLLQDVVFPAAPGPVPAAVPQHPWRSNIGRRVARWKIKDFTYGYLEEPNTNQHSQFEDDRVTQLTTHLEGIAQDILTRLITSAPLAAASNLMAGWYHNLQSYNTLNVTGGLIEGYNDALATAGRQIINFSLVTGGPTTGNVWRHDLTGGTLTTSPTIILDMLFERVKPRPSFLVVPQRFLRAYKQSMIDRGMVMPTIHSAVGGFNINIDNRIGVDLPAYNGIPMVTISDEIYTRAGYTMTGAVYNCTGSYPVFAVYVDGSNPGRGCHIGFMGQALADRPETIPVNGIVTNLGTGIQLVKGGYVVESAGYKRVLTRVLNANWVHTVGQPQAVAILEGNKD